MKLSLTALFLALASSATASMHETSTKAKIQPAGLTTYRNVIKGILPLQQKPVFVDMDDDKKSGNSDDKKDKDDDDDKKSKDDDDGDKKSRNSSVPDCTTSGVNYNKCNPATMNPSDKATCNSIKNSVCGSNTSSSDMDYCKCIGLHGQAVVTSAGFHPVLKGTGPSKRKQVFVDLDKDDNGGKADDGKKNTDNGNKGTDDKGTDDNKTDDNGTDDKKNDDNGTDDKKTDDGIVDDKTNDHKQAFVDLDKDDDGAKKGGGNDDKKDTGNNDDKKNVVTNDDKKSKNTDDDDKKRKNDDDDDKKNKDHDDDKKNKDDDDDDKSRSSGVPECITGGKNYLRCDPATMKSSDKATCDSIKNEVRGKNMSSVDKSYCECIGLDGKVTAQLRGTLSAVF